MKTDRKKMRFGQLWQQWSSRSWTLLRTRIARPMIYRMRRRLVFAGIARASEVHLLGLRLRTDPGVFHPLYFSSSRILAEDILERSLRGLSVLDMGTGTGPIALAAARAGARVTACDVNPRAVAVSRQNSSLNSVQIEVIESDLFTGVSGRRFDIICFNIPFFADDPATHLEAAFNAGRNLETLRRFARGSVEHLQPNGRVAIILSEDCDCNAVLDTFAEAGLEVESRRTTSRLLELFHVVWLRAAAGLQA